MVTTLRCPPGGASRRSRAGSGGHGQRDRGAAMVELALVLPVLVLLLVGIVEAGRAYGAHVALQGAARDGARLAALGSPSSEVQNAVYATAGPADVVGVEVTACASGRSGQAAVRVQARHLWRLPFIDLGETTLNATARMPCET